MEDNIHEKIEMSLNADTDTLFAVIGYYDNKSNLDISMPSKDDLINKGKKWLDANELKLQKVICSNNFVQKYLVKDKEQTFGQIDLILVLMSIIDKENFIIPSINIATLIVKLGLNKLCHVETNLGQ